MFLYSLFLLLFFFLYSLFLLLLIFTASFTVFALFAVSFTVFPLFYVSFTVLNIYLLFFHCFVTFTVLGPDNQTIIGLTPCFLIFLYIYALLLDTKDYITEP